MAWWSRAANVFRGGRLGQEVDEELAAHLEEAIARGRDPEEARRALGSTLRLREESRDAVTAAWLDSLRADVVFAWRQLTNQKVASLAAIASLALAIGACTSAFRLIDAVLLRPLPVAQPEQLYTLAKEGIGFDGKPERYDSWAYPSFDRMRAAVKSEAELLAISYATRLDVTYGGAEDFEKAQLQYVSGALFRSFGLRAARGRLLDESDDRGVRQHPVAVIASDYWTRRFGRDPSIVGRRFRAGDDVYEIVGVVDGPFTGTEPGTSVDIFVPTAMSPRVLRSDQTWIRIMARVATGVSLEPLRARLQATSRAFEEERVKSFTGLTRATIDQFLDQRSVLVGAAAGASLLQQDYGPSLVALAALVGLVLLMACANVATLKTAQAAGRAREMALRVSLGAGRVRLVQLVAVEGSLLACLAGIAGTLFAWWAAPFVVGRIAVPGNRVDLALPVDWRTRFFALALTLGVALLCSLAPALRASAVTPAAALKGGGDAAVRRRLLHSMIAVQAAFCFVVLFAAGLFVVTFQRLSERPLGFSAEGVVVLDTIATQPQTPVVWDQVADAIRAVPGVRQAALAGWPLLWPANSWNGFVSVNGAPPGPVLAYFLGVSPGWVDTMKIRLLDGRDFRPEDTSPGAALVNRTFANEFFGGTNVVGQRFSKGNDPYRVVGVVDDVPYRNLREPVLPVAYVPFRTVDARNVLVPRNNAALIVRVPDANAAALAPMLRQAIARARPGLRVSVILTQAEIDAAHTVRERLLATMAVFFSIVALILAGVGLYGVLDYSVLQRRREIGIRMALGAKLGHVVRRVAAPVFGMVVAGAAGGLAIGLAAAPYVRALLYDVKATDPRALIVPSLALAGVALFAALAPVVHASRIDPASTLRSD